MVQSDLSLTNSNGCWSSLKNSVCFNGTRVYSTLDPSTFVVPISDEQTILIMMVVSKSENAFNRRLTPDECSDIFRVSWVKDNMSGELDNVREDWSLLAKNDDPQYYKDWLHVMQMMSELFLRKNKDYGTSNLASGWTQGIAVRLGDKVSRVWNILLNKHQFEIPESVGETFLDIAAYGIIGYMMESGMWETAELRHTIGLPALVRYWMSNNDLSEEDIDEVMSYIVANEIVKDGFPGKIK